MSDGYTYSDKSDFDIARLINLALLLHDGISEQDAGFDAVVSLNDRGLAQVARIVGEVRAAAKAGTEQPSMGSENERNAKP
jgi:hypothetical protein